jgi:hypothetical protein
MQVCTKKSPTNIIYKKIITILLKNQEKIKWYFIKKTYFK